MHPGRDGVQYVMRYQQGAIVKGGTVVTHQCIRTKSNKISTFDLHQTKIFESSSFSNGQHHRTSTFDLLPEGGNAKIRFVCIKAISPTNPVPCLEIRPFRSGDSVPQQIWGNQFLYAFPPFCLILQVLKKVSYDQTEKILLVTPTWQSQILYPLLLEMSLV